MTEKKKMKYMSFSNFLMALIVSVLFLAPLVLIGLKSAGVQFPEDMGVLPTRLYAESRTLKTPPEFSPEKVQEKKFQDEFESYYSDIIPMRDETLFLDAAVKRFPIHMSNMVFNFPAYPTFYGSKRYYVPDSDSLVFEPVKRDENLVKGAENFCIQLKNLAKEFPNKRFIFCLLPGGAFSLHNPLTQYAEDPLPTDMWADAFINNMSGQPNVFFYTDAKSYEDRNSYYKNYFRSDHHWNIRGAARCFEQVFNALGRPLAAPYAFKKADEAPLLGSSSLIGLMPVLDEVEDLIYDPTTVNYIGPDGSIQLYPMHEFEALSPKIKSCLFYSEYFDKLPMYRVINTGAGKQGRAMLISDSYGALAREFLAQQYAEVIPLRHLQGESILNDTTPDTKLRNFIIANNPDDIFIVCIPNGIFEIIPKYCPNYLM